jgi:MFS family permease
MNQNATIPSGGSDATRYKWWVVFMLWFVCFFNYADRQAISSVFPLLQQEFGFEDWQLGMIGSAFMWVYAGVAPAAGVAADRFSRKWLIVAACVVWSFFTLATAWGGNLTMLVVVRALTGLGETFYFPAAMSLISDYHARQTRSRAMSWHQSAVYAGTILGSWMAAVLAERSGWRLPFLMFGPLGIVLALVLGRFLREPQRGGVESARTDTDGERLSVGQTLGLIFRTPAALFLMGGFLCANFVATIFLVWTPKFLVDKFHFHLGAAGLTGTIYIHLASAIVVPLAGWGADRLCQRWVWGRMGVQLAGLLAGAVFVFLVGTTSSTTTLVLVMALFGVCKGCYDSGIFASLYDVVDPRARGAAAGLMNTIGWGGGALGPLFVGFATRFGKRATPVENMSDAIAFGGLLYLAAAACLVAAILAMRRGARAKN